MPMLPCLGSKVKFINSSNISILYGSKCWVMGKEKKNKIDRMSVAGMRMFRWTRTKRRKDGIRKTIRDNLGVTVTEHKTREKYGDQNMQ